MNFSLQRAAPSVAALVVSLSLGQFVGISGQAATPSTFDRVQYLGGAAGFRGTSYRWDNKLTVSPTRIQMKDRKGVLLFEIEPFRISRLSYIDDSNGSVPPPPSSPWDFVPFRVVDPPRTTRAEHHLIALEYVLDDCRPAAVLLRAHKDNYKEVMTALSVAHKTAHLETSQGSPAAGDGHQACQ